MTTNTKTIIRAAMAADQTITPEEAIALNAALNGAINTPNSDLASERAYSYMEAAALLGVKTSRSIQNYVRAGKLVAVRTGAKGKRGHSVTGASLRKFLSGVE